MFQVKFLRYTTRVLLVSLSLYVIVAIAIVIPRNDTDIRHANSISNRDNITLSVSKSFGSTIRGSFKGMMNLGQGAKSRFQAGGNYVGTRISDFKGKLKKKIPKRLRKFFHWPAFTRFKVKFNKIYKSIGEEILRHLIYLANRTIVGIQHMRYLSGLDKHLLGVTQFADWNNEEYHNTYNNQAAEMGPIKEAGELRPEQRAKMEQLAREGKNIFGKPVVEGRSGNLAAKQAFGQDEASNRSIRKKRDVGVNYDHDDDEEFSVGDGDFDFDDDSDGEAKSDLDDEDIVDKFAAEWTQVPDLDQLDQIEISLDEALNANSGFKPIDLRETGCIITSDNQFNCGSCYAHATSTVASYYNCMQSSEKKLQRYHARFISDCGRYLTGERDQEDLRGCNGGKVFKAVYFARMVGVQTFNEYQCARVSHGFDTDQCAYPKPMDLLEHGWKTIPVPYFKHSQFTNIKLSEVDLHLRTIGPVFVNMITFKDFDMHRAGIYDGLVGSNYPTVHSMIIVGHDRDSRGRDYWIIWNSHGVAWGERGFLRVYNESLENFMVFAGGMMPSFDLNEINDW